jgi:hypothetical protein
MTTHLSVIAPLLGSYQHKTVKWLVCSAGHDGMGTPSIDYVCKTQREAREKADSQLGSWIVRTKRRPIAVTA